MVDGAGLRIPRHLADELLAHARAGLPNEACGILSGSLQEGVARDFHATRNEEASPLRYSIHTEDLYRVVTAIDDRGEDVVAIFHSHTRSPAVPSPTDIRAAMYPDAFYLLASLADPDASPVAALRAWRIRDDRSVEAPLELI